MNSSVRYALVFLLLPLTLFSQVNTEPAPANKSTDTTWTTGLQTLFTSKTIGDRVTTQLRSAFSQAEPGFILSFGIIMSRKKMVKADDETKAILKTHTGKRIQLPAITTTLPDFLKGPAELEAILHFQFTKEDISLLKNEQLTGVKIITASGSYNYDLHESAQEILNAQLKKAVARII